MPAPQQVIRNENSEDSKKTKNSEKEQKEIVAVNENMFKPLNIKSIEKKKEILNRIKPKDYNLQEHIYEEPFTENELMLEWINYSKILEKQGEKIIYSLFTLNKPTIIDGHILVHKVPNASSKMEFDRIKTDLLGYIRGKLKNHKIELRIEEESHEFVSKVFNKEDKLKRFLEINPDIMLLKTTFDLDLN